MLQPVGPLHPELGPGRVQRLLEPRQQLQRLATRRRRVDQQHEGHAVDVHWQRSLVVPLLIEAVHREAPVPHSLLQDRFEAVLEEAALEEAAA